MKLLKSIKLKKELFQVKDIEKSSSRKLQRVIYYVFYGLIPRTNEFKNYFLHTIVKHPKFQKKILKFGTYIYIPYYPRVGGMGNALFIKCNPTTALAARKGLTFDLLT